MIRRTITIALTIAALCLSMVATASAAPRHRGVTGHHVTRIHRTHRAHRHSTRHVRQSAHHARHVRHSAGVTRAVAHHDPIAVTALGVHHISDPIAYAA